MRHVLSVGLVFLTACSSPAAGAPPEAARLAPASTVVYLETAAAEEILPKLLDHPLTARLRALPQYRGWEASPERAELMQGIAFVQWQLGVPWQTAIEKLTSGGVYALVDGATQAAAVLLETDDPAFASKAVQTLVDIARADASEQGRADPIREADYRGVHAFLADGVCIGVVDRWIVAATSAELAKAIVDRHRDDSAASLADSQEFVQARQGKGRNATAWLYVDLATVRNAGLARELFAGQAPDPGAELLFGGLMSTLRETPLAAAEFSIDRDELELRLTTPHDPSWTPEGRRYYFGPDQSGAAPPQLGLADTVLEVRAYRQVAGIFLAAPELFSEEINANLAKANSDLTTLFGGRPFAEEILAALDGGLRVVVAREPAGQAMPQNAAIRLPGFAVVGRLNNPDDAQRPLRIAFQTAIGFVNLNAAQQGMPPLELETARSPERTLLSASYWSDGADAAASDAADQPMMAARAMRMQLSPTLAFQEDAIILASTKTLAARLCDRLAEGSRASGTSLDGVDDVHSALAIDAAALSELVAENRQHLIAQNMLEKGHRREEAEEEIAGLEALLKFFEGADAHIAVDPDQIELKVRLQVNVEESR